MAQERLHVVPHGDGWAVKWEGKDDAVSTHATQKEAVEAGRDLAQRSEADLLVVHRSDGTFRKVYSVGGEAEDMSDRHNTGGDSRERRVEANDLISVGSRISWGAVLAGAAVALTLAVLFGVLLSAIGLTARDATVNRGMYITAFILSLVAMLAALFVGGFIVSRITAGEDKLEAMTYGVVLWGVFFLGLSFLAAGGINVGSNALALRNEAAVALPAGATEGLDQAAVDRLNANLRAARPNIDPATAAWLFFAGMVLSLAAAVGGSVAGAGPTLVLRRLRERHAAAFTGTTAPTAYQTSNR